MFRNPKTNFRSKGPVRKKNKFEPEPEDPEEDMSQESESGDEDEDIDESSAEENDNEEQDETTRRTAIRQELSTLTFEELEGLKAKLGTKVYNEAMFGSKASGSKGKTKKSSAVVFKRDNPNRPREISSKTRVPRVREVVHVKKRRHRDPRFEDLCGELDETLWKTNYSFLTEIAEKEKESLTEKLKNDEVDEEQKLQIKEYLQRMKNKERSDAQKKKLEDKRRREKEENVERMKEGKRPYFMKKSTRKYLDLADKYDELKTSGKLENYLKKKRKKNAIRDKKSMK